VRDLALEVRLRCGGSQTVDALMMTRLPTAEAAGSTSLDLCRGQCLRRAGCACSRCRIDAARFASSSSPLPGPVLVLEPKRKHQGEAASPPRLRPASLWLPPSPVSSPVHSPARRPSTRALPPPPDAHLEAGPPRTPRPLHAPDDPVTPPAGILTAFGDVTALRLAPRLLEAVEALGGGLMERRGVSEADPPPSDSGHSKDAGGVPSLELTPPKSGEWFSGEGNAQNTRNPHAFPTQPYPPFYHNRKSRLCRNLRFSLRQSRYV